MPFSFRMMRLRLPRMALRRSLKLRILVAMLGVYVLGFATLAVYIVDIRDDARRVVAYIQAQEIAAGFRTGDPLSVLPTRMGGGELTYTLYSADGKVLGTHPPESRPRRLWRDLWPDGGWLRWPSDRGHVINVPVALEDGAILMVAKRDVRERQLIETQLMDRLYRGAWIMLPVGALAMLLILWLLYWTLGPVWRAATLAGKIGPAAPDRRLPTETLPAEVRDLAQAVNVALDRLSDAYQAERRFVADAAHELRTPLSVLWLRLQALRKGMTQDWTAAENDMRELERMVGQLLALARQDGAPPQADAGQALDVSQGVRECADAMLPLYAASSRVLRVQVQDGLTCQGAQASLHEIVGNLLDNALRHGSGAVLLRAGRQGDRLFIEVQDQGQGPAQPDAMFERFRKGDAGRSGSGLGLAIVRQAAINLGGTVAFVAGTTCCVRVVWPTARSSLGQAEAVRQ